MYMCPRLRDRDREIERHETETNTDTDRQKDHQETSRNKSYGHTEKYTRGGRVTETETETTDWQRR
jgi:hypothetical protein